MPKQQPPLPGTPQMSAEDMALLRADIEYLERRNADHPIHGRTIDSSGCVVPVEETIFSDRSYYKLS